MGYTDKAAIARYLVGTGGVYPFIPSIRCTRERWVGGMVSYPYIPPSRLAEVAGETADMLTKFGDKIHKQMTKRGWTKESVNQTINNPSKQVKTTDTRFNPDGSKNSEPATAYLNQDGSYVVRNDNTGDIVQVSNRKDPNWKSPFGE